MKLNSFVRRWEPLAKLGGWIYVVLGALAAAATWVATIQISVAANTSDIRDLRDEVKPIEVIREDVKWIKKRLGGPD